MTSSHRSWVGFACVVLPLALLLGGCMSSRPQAFRLAFLPSAPAPGEPTFEEAPKLTPTFPSHESPSLLHRALATQPPPPEAEVRIAKAEDRFEAGRKLYQQRDTAGA